MIEVAIVLLALAAGFSAGVFWERRYWINSLERLADRISQSYGDMD